MSVMTNASYGLSPGHQAKGRARPSTPFPHIDDLLAVPKDIDPNQSIKRLLDMTETSLRQSEVSRNFDRPALALKDYIRASILAVQVIVKHKDYPVLRDSRSESGRLHNAILKRISQQTDIYEDIKRNIMEDNKRTGVQPTVKRSAPPSPSKAQGTGPPPASLVNGEAASSRPQTKANGRTLQPVNGSPAKTKPAVLPKPQSLHGNAIVPGSGRSAPANNPKLDLTARFANLRGPQSCPGQDPRIKTYPIPTQKPSGPWQMPGSPELDVDSDPTASALPKVPDAIYSPARTGSSTSLSSMPSMLPPQTNEFTPAVPTSAVPEEEEEPVELPEEDNITAEQLCKVMKAKLSILLIDIRSREEFDEGHIMSSSIICIEPSILLRENISSEEISESMVLSPNPEQALFERRDSYDLVVFYDQDSERVPQSPKSSDELVVVSLHRALEHLNYGRRLKRSPRILRGGLGAWVDLMGPLALQPTTSTTSTSSATLVRQKRNGFIQRKGHKFVVTSLQPADVKAWENTLEKDAHQTAARPSFPRTAREFLSSTPIAAQQQSMKSPAAIEERQQHGFGSLTPLPAPPARPRAAVQRLSHSGLSQGDDGNETYSEPGSSSLQRSTARSKKPTEQVSAAVKAYTGLNNPRNWCYANSTLQSLLGSPGFGRELADSEWVHKYSVPRKEDEKIDPPQLMVRILSNLFHWMSTGTFETMKAQTLMDYSRQLCKSSEAESQFGGSHQQDAQEFMSFIMEQLHDETNPCRNKAGNAKQPTTSGRPLVRAAMEYWANHSEFNQSIIDRYWRGIELSTVKCMECDTRTHTFSPFGLIPVPVTHDQDMTLSEALSDYVAGNQLDDFRCDHCNGEKKATQSLSLARMPPLLCVSFRRFHYHGQVLSKSNTIVSWDFNDFDFAPYFLDASEQDGDAKDRAFSGPFRYECYAVVTHAGRQLNIGHYYAYVRDSSTRDQHSWYCCNDSKVSKVRIGSGDSNDMQKEVFRSGDDRVPYLVFFRRKDA
ncbi:ubiquitin carboxyl-terminal hydrolase domain-containing protein [Hirsutella rhossiliensis]|uniref:Ubiquitin carboxyl-terminal hydrolase domain-containing protein n=1 Tax=Hirsutella rhossiliensis TaxID=111463 RepID=A0A9P8SE97_9HYPO|nr:ubiquitin carboxyl-terminal hydrolase domain-containing protein [Hirsutella rhossiliensis]KAH0958744.1 ubiquitin carboxyl-terminal hydrolase domain-containing protein [Hirsutella rhossiliensis]